MKTLAWIMLIFTPGDGGGVAHVPFETQALCQRARSVILAEFNVYTGSPRIFCMQRALVDASRILPEQIPNRRPQ